MQQSSVQQSSVQQRAEVFAVLRQDLLARQPSSSSRPLYPVSSIVSGDWNYALPTLAAAATQQLQRNKMLVSREAFKEVFERSYGRYLAQMDYNNVLVAGGCVSATMLQQKWNNDVDIFLYGLTPQQADNKVVALLQSFIDSNRMWEYKKAHGDEALTVVQNKSVVITRTSSVITLYGDTKIQIILRLYARKEDILYGFDLGSCAIGYDGADVLLSGLGKYTYEHLVNIVDPSRRSTTYEHRLEKYFHRGFSIVLPHLAIDHMRTEYFKYTLPEVAELAYFPFSYTALKGNKITLGTILHLRNNGCTATTPSDYDSGEDVDEHKIFYLNLRNLARGGDSYYYYTETLSAESIVHTVPYITASRVSDYYDSLGRKIFDGRTLDVRVFSEYFSVDLLSHIVTSIFLDKDCEALERLLQQQKQMVLERLQLAQTLDHSMIAWNEADPATQLTGSFNPVLSDARDWYGAYYDDE